MRGFPQHLNTKQDFLNVLGTMPEETKAALQRVFENRFSWQPVRKLKDTEKPKENATKKVVELASSSFEMDTETQPERWLYELKEDPNAWFFAAGVYG